MIVLCNVCAHRPCLTLGLIKVAEDIDSFQIQRNNYIGEKTRGQADLLSQKYQNCVLEAIEITGVHLIFGC